MKVTRFDAALTYILAGLGLWISYTALADLAARAGLGQWQAAAWPLVVDGLILAATRAVVTFGAHDARKYAWTLLGCAAAASIAGNVAHALLPAGPVHPAIAAIVAVVPPVAALAMTHLAVVRARVRQDTERTDAEPASPQVESASPPDAPAPQDSDRSIVDAPEPDFIAHLVSVDAPTDSVADTRVEPADAVLAAPAPRPTADARQRVLELLDTTDMSNRAIAAEVDVSESTVRRWKTARGLRAA